MFVSIRDGIFFILQEQQAQLKEKHVVIERLQLIFCQKSFEIYKYDCLSTASVKSK